MKKISLYHFVMLCFLVSFLFLAWSCSKMNDTQATFVDRKKQVYLGKVDSIESFPGLKRAKITWYVGADPRVTQTIVYWNNRKDSIIVDFNRNTPGQQKDSVIIDSLPEGTFLFEFRNINNKGETSLYSSASVTIWGPKFADGLHGRNIKSYDFNYDQKTYTLGLSPTAEGDGVMYSQMTYSDIRGMDQTVRIVRDTDSVQLNNFPSGGELLFRTAFKPSGGIDTIFTSYDTLYAPTAVSGKGVKLALKGDMGSQYFSRNDSLYEWKDNGNINIYVFKENGSLARVKSLPSAISRDDYKIFFFYDANRFIGINTADQVVMLKKEINTFTTISDFGNGFHFVKFIPAIGFFYSVTSGTGDLRTWVAKDDASWGSPNGTTVGTGFDKYDPLMLFQGRYLMGVDSTGILWSMSITADGKIDIKRRIGSGWDKFKKVVSVGSRLLCLDKNDNFYLFKGFKPGGSSLYVVH